MLGPLKFMARLTLDLVTLPLRAATLFMWQPGRKHKRRR